MSLIQCPDCGREISDAARSCPHCGRPMRSVQEDAGKVGTAIGRWVAGALAMVVAIALCLFALGLLYQTLAS